MSHTPGPWQIVGSRICSAGNDIERKTIARVELSIGDAFAVSDANADLIAAAPELLATCKELVKEFEKLPHALGYEFDVIPKAREVIAKAEKGG